MYSILDPKNQERETNMAKEIMDNERVEYRDFVASWSWQWYATLTFKDPTSEYKAQKLLKEYSTMLGLKYKIQIGYIGSLGYEHKDSISPTIHLLMIGRNKHNQSLYDIPDKQAEFLWQRRNGSARIDVVEDNKSVSAYLTKHIYHERQGDLMIYNQKLLKKMKGI